MEQRSIRARSHSAEPLVALEPCSGFLEGGVQPQERCGELGIGNDRLGEGDVGQKIGLVIAGERGQIGDLDDDEARRPRPAIDGRAGVRL